MHAEGSWCVCVCVSEPSKGRVATERSGDSGGRSSSICGSSVANVHVRVRVCVRGGGKRREEADAAGLPGEEAGVGE